MARETGRALRPAQTFLPPRRLPEPTPNRSEGERRDRTAPIARPARIRSATLAAAIFAAAASAFAQKDDVIVLVNGDRVTGEIKTYYEGRLTVDTSHSSWIKVKWSLIESITSDKQFDVETTDGVHHYGTLAPSDPPGQLTIVSGPQTVTVGFFDVFGLTPVYQTFWKRWEGSLDFGFNYTQSNDLIQLNFAFDGVYRMRESQFVVGLSAFFSRQDDVTAASRGSFGLAYDRFLGTDWVAEALVGLDRNVQLGLDLRETVGVAAGRYLVRTNQASLIVLVGFTGNHEIPVEGTDTDSAEAAVGGRYSYFMYDYPKLTLSTNLGVYPSLTISGRVRVEFLASVKREIVSDFYLSLSIFDSFDSRDPTTLTPKNDWGPTVSIGWKF
jgi:hypothetical protein